MHLLSVVVLSGDRPFECDICLSRFTLKHSMVRHRRKHMTEGLGVSGEAPCSASDEDSVHTSTPVEESKTSSSNVKSYLDLLSAFLSFIHFFILLYLYKSCYFFHVAVGD